MVIVGANVGSTKSGMPLNDGGCALYKDGVIYAIAEERLSRKKYVGGFKRALEYCLDAAKVDIREVDLFVFSSCCEEPLTEDSIHLEGVGQERIWICKSHHLSHAFSTFCTSGFQQAVIIVIDNEGNVLDDKADKPFHQREMEHMSYYLGDRQEIRLLHRDYVDPEYIGVGDAYRYFTHYLGFPSYEYAGKTMGLAAYGSDEPYKDHRVFELRNGHIECRIRNNYENCIQSLSAFFDALGADCPKPRSPLDDITQVHADLARWIQRETEDILVEKINHLVSQSGIRDVCIAGGIGLNSVANAQILKRCKLDHLHIIPAAGDSGQCLGNVLYGLYLLTGKVPSLPMKTAYLGKEYSNEDIADAVSSIATDSNIEVRRFDSLASLAKEEASLIMQNKYVGHFYGRSEFGPRALGNRSILANPCNPDSKDRLNQRIKFRESFRPFAPVVIFEEAQDFFDLNEERPFMLIVSDVKDRSLIPSVTHVDGTARVQTITENQNPQLYSLLEEFKKLSGVPILLNTSFNVAGEPIVETPMDAVKCFLSTALDALAISNYLIIKKTVSTKHDPFHDFITSLGRSL